MTRRSCLQQVYDWLERSTLIKVLEKLGHLGIMVAVAVWASECRGRREAEELQAWMVLDQVRTSDRSDARISALELLARRGRDLSEIDLQNAWLVGAKLPGVRFAFANLSNASLRCADLRGADMMDLRLYASLDLRGADLRRAQLDRSVLGGWNLEGADLRDATMRDSELHGAEFFDSDLRGADLSGSRGRPALAGARIDGRTMLPAEMEYLWKVTNGRALTLIGADLRQRPLPRAKLKDIDLSGADLTSADLRDADLRNTRLTGTSFVGAILAGADLRGADVTGADFKAADLRYARVEGVDFSVASLGASDSLSYACGTDTTKPQPAGGFSEDCGREWAARRQPEVGDCRERFKRVP